MAKATLCQDGTLMFECPGCNCFHGVATTQPFANGAMWQWNGNLDAPTISPSVLVKIGPRASFDMKEQVCHSFVRSGRIEFLSDSTHPLAGQTVDLPDWED